MESVILLEMIWTSLLFVQRDTSGCFFHIVNSSFLRGMDIHQNWLDAGSQSWCRKVERPGVPEKREDEVERGKLIPLYLTFYSLCEFL